MNRTLFATHRTVPPAHVAREISLGGIKDVADESLRPVYALYAIRAFNGETGDLVAGTPHGEAAAAGYAKGVELREAEHRSDDLRQELIDIAVTHGRAGGL